ncbi:replication initiation negative regulator SeqA [Budvicia diplopodorum]|uniref:replication initiation negative regulator SeqA n=1 Tax=Budvicia diplopodorum TaxID=1119056 RepID=UPI001358B7A1|nr:replication initiation negative regulator SeqA [Budvicia diplopodorum]
MKTIEVDEELYRYIASQTLHIGESASEILRRMLNFTPAMLVAEEASHSSINASINASVAPASVAKVVSPAERSQRIGELLLSEEFNEQKKAVDRFLLILSVLYQINKNDFADATESLHGRTRIYFSNAQETLLQNGRHTKPKAVPETPYWVITNTNSERKRSMVEHIMAAMQFPAELIQQTCGSI